MASSQHANSINFPVRRIPVRRLARRSSSAAARPPPAAAHRSGRPARDLGGRTSVHSAKAAPQETDAPAGPFPRRGVGRGNRRSQRWSLGGDFSGDGRRCGRVLATADLTEALGAESQWISSDGSRVAGTNLLASLANFSASLMQSPRAVFTLAADLTATAALLARYSKNIIALRCKLFFGWLTVHCSTPPLQSKWQRSSKQLKS